MGIEDVHVDEVLLPADYVISLENDLMGLNEIFLVCDPSLPSMNFPKIIE